MNRNESDDARFQELMAREFPLGLVPERPQAGPATAATPDAAAEPAVESASPAASAAVPEEPVGDFRSWTPPEEPEDEFVPPPAPPAGRWSPAGIAGTVLVVLPLLLALAAAFGVRFPMLVSVLSGAGFFLGVVLLLYRLRQRPPIDGDGAVV
ncbi:MAG: hypothetical protein QM582_05075 [Micropruina sp.]|uniref:hypothetical protein n=1 Tax=Micropruina sp. TaxID=2737536 RepID=UPI0039E31249